MTRREKSTHKVDWLRKMREKQFDESERDDVIKKEKKRRFNKQYREALRLLELDE